MATFAIKGLDILSSASGQITAVKTAGLQIVSSLGDSGLDYSYVTEGRDSAEVTLSNYNILLNSVHLNDGVLPDRIELFEVTWESDEAQQTSQLLNLAFETDGQTRDCLFVTKGTPFPNWRDPDMLSWLLEGAQFGVVGDGQPDQIALDQMPDVSISGVIRQLFGDDGARLDEDQFHFFQPSDQESYDAFEYDAILVDDPDDLAPEEVVIPFEPETIEPYVPDAGLSDMAG